MMGIFIHMNISKSVTKREWKNVYEETLQLVKNFPLIGFLFCSKARKNVGIPMVNAPIRES